MLQMSAHINTDWKKHVGTHRRHLLHLPPRPAGAGERLVHAIPAARHAGGMRGDRAGKNAPSPVGRLQRRCRTIRSRRTC